ncbi:MAG: LAGLIDADG family homing endonuclease [archaeon]|nr:LAGLIDADG family homing endonuclease [archaeon]
MIEMTPDLAEICGIHAGDGYLRLREKNKGEVDISGNIEEKEYYDNHVVLLFNNTFNLSIKGRYFSRGSYGFVCYKKEVRETLMNLGFPSGKKSLFVNVPNLILNSEDKTLMCRFLRGLFDTDGNLSFRKSYNHSDKFKNKNNYYPTIKLTTISGQLAEGTIKMLNQLNIIFYYYNRESKKPNENKKHVIVISGLDGLNKWMDLIGIKNPVKSSRYLVWKKQGFCPTNTTLKQREELLKEN